MNYKNMTKLEKLQAAKIKTRRAYCEFMNAHQEELTPDEIKAVEKLMENVKKASEAYAKEYSKTKSNDSNKKTR
jgi:hypothetical protein